MNESDAKLAAGLIAARDKAQIALKIMTEKDPTTWPWVSLEFQMKGLMDGGFSLVTSWEWSLEPFVVTRDIWAHALRQIITKSNEELDLLGVRPNEP